MTDQAAMRLVPVECTDEIAEAIAKVAHVCGGIAESIWSAALAAAPTQPSASEREAIARIIDPPAWSDRERSTDKWRRTHTLKKADAILAILATRPTSAGVEAATIERCAKVAEDQTRLNAQARRDRADDTLAFEFEGLGKVIATAIRSLSASGDRAEGGEK